MRALVTGGGGFLGSWIVRQLLSARAEVRVLGRHFYPELAALGVECQEGDIQSALAVEEAMRGADVVFHVAGRPGIWGPKDSFFGPNFAGTERVIEGCKRAGIRRLVFTSSPSAVFGRASIEGGDESLPYPERYLCHYSASKAAAEKLVIAAHEPGRLHTVALRPHLIWGPGDRFLVPGLIAAARTGRVKRVGDGHNLVSVTYVENAASAHLAAAEAIVTPDAPAGGKAYFIADAEPVELWSFIDRILAGLGEPPIAGRVPFRAAYAAGGVLELLHHLFFPEREPRMTRFLAAQLGMAHWFRIDAARRDLRWTPRISTAEGLERLITSLLASQVA